MKTARTLLDGKLYGLTLLEAGVSIELQRREVHKNIISIITPDKTITFSGVVPFYYSSNTILHNETPLIVQMMRNPIR